MREEKGKKIRYNYDHFMLLSLIFLTAFGLVMIYSSSSYTAQVRLEKEPTYYLFRQAKVALVGLVGMVIISTIDYRVFFKLSIPALFIAYLLCAVVMVIGKEFNGKKRWIGVGGFTIQPSEFAKLALILFLSYMITVLGKEINSLRGVFKIVAFTFPLILLVAVSNLSAGIILLSIVGTLIFVSTRIKWPFILLGISGLSFLRFGPQFLPDILPEISFLSDYQKMRILVWMDPEKYANDGGFQVLQGIYAIGSGGLRGKGLGESMQKLGIIPEAQNDMIFSIICEELGLFGAVTVIIVFLFLLYRCTAIADSAPDMYGGLLVSGVMAHIGVQVVLNIAVVTGIVPNTGITLPFISYGGSSVLFLMAEMGLVLGVARQIKIEY
ncbi:MAG: putative peptidoglycan glycosyltransferase FtsW [Johnsonella sp.]|nr:putative peptidoglycan glycosyltransferase FtsW [Johnsonella sp.]